MLLGRALGGGAGTGGAGPVADEDDEGGVCAPTSAAWTLGSRKQKKRAEPAAWAGPRSGPVHIGPRGVESAGASLAPCRSGRITLQLASSCSKERQKHTRRDVALTEQNHGGAAGLERSGRAAVN